MRGLVLVRKWDILDAFYRYHLRTEDVEYFYYVVPSIPLDPALLLFIDLVILMG